MSFAPEFALGNFIPETITIPDNEVDMRIFLKQVLEEHARLINRKDTAQYENVEVPSNQTFPGTDIQTKRFIFRKIVDTGALLNNATNSVAHGITGIDNNWLFTRIYGTAREPAGAGLRPFFIPMPNSGPSYQIQLMVDTTNVNITTIANLTAFTTSQVILEFYKI